VGEGSAYFKYANVFRSAIAPLICARFSTQVGPLVLYSISFNRSTLRRYSRSSSGVLTRFLLLPAYVSGFTVRQALKANLRVSF